MHIFHSPFHIYICLYLSVSACIQLALDDVMLLSKSLDGALTEYHKSKLDDVNLALNDYWQEVYQGKFDIIMLS